MGGHSQLEQEDGGGSAGDGLPTWEQCPSPHDPPDVQDLGGGIPRVGWALEGITADTRGGIVESAVTPPKVGKGQRKSAQPGVSITAEKGDILPGGRDATASTVITGPETTARVIAQEGPSIVTGQETTARVIAQEGPSIVTGQETTARVIAQEGPSIVTGQETTAGVIAQEGSSIVTGQQTTAGVSAQEGPGCHSPAGQ
ncbi:hypothetical protein NDU88_005835 [Pleurodeles waltl]|uniref:Uncharacterized protein n=1 Tax=Pleurodeles waltl TaxID=8319 RepID=A0AAV7LQ66_PLEWA|nr:hypothetical protein NDU88_005835 [Pleurodeles waltl]